MDTPEDTVHCGVSEITSESATGVRRMPAATMAFSADLRFRQAGRSGILVCPPADELFFRRDRDRAEGCQQYTYRFACIRRVYNRFANTSPARDEKKRPASYFVEWVFAGIAGNDLT